MNQRDKIGGGTASFYQIYPRSFQDTTATASAISGDHRAAAVSAVARRRRGLAVADLPSPMADFGYDISDYTGIDPLFGTMAISTRW
jgi:alpha-glucosidase